MDKHTPTTIWKEYERGKSYNLSESVNLYERVKQNEDFFTGNQWKGINAPDLDKPVLNFLKRVVTYFISMIVSDDVTASISPFIKDDNTSFAAQVLTQEIERIIERAKVKALNRDLLRNAVVDGDGCFYLYFDTSIPGNGPTPGEIAVQMVDNTNIYFGNPVIWEVQEQPYLLIVRSQQLDTVRRRAKELGLDPELIRPDNEDDLLDGGEAREDLTTTIVRLWKENGTVRFMETTQDLVLRDETDTGYRLYPVAYMSWEKIKNSYHGQAAITGLIPNQIAVNKLWAMAIMHQRNLAFPKIIYDQSKIHKWTNRAGEAIGTVGDPNNSVASAFRAPDMSNQVVEIVEKTITLTRDFMGASDAALGNVKPDNTSAIIAVQKASSAPLELQRLAFYQFIEDYIRIFLELIRVHYGVRQIGYTDEDGNETALYFDFSQLDYNAMQLKVDVGSSAYWSEVMQIQTLDNLFQNGIITDAVTYLEGIPDAYVKNKNKIIAQLKEKQNAMGMQQGGGEVNGGTAMSALPQPLNDPLLAAGGGGGPEPGYPNNGV